MISPFIKEQMESLRILGIETSLFQVTKKGWFGYFINIFKLARFLKYHNPDLIHAHYGLCGLLGNTQRRIPVITTFHGSDINNPVILRWSKLAHRLSAASIFVDKHMMKKISRHKYSEVIPCGVDISLFYQVPKEEARRKLNLKENAINILFSSDFSNPVKNYPLAQLVCERVEKNTGMRVNLIELKGMSRETVNLNLNASDCAILFSSYEGSPQFIKEAMACNCPVVATDVGDVSLIIGGIHGCYISSPDIEEMSSKIKMAIDNSCLKGQTTGRERIVALGLDTFSIAKRIIELYNSVLEY